MNIRINFGVSIILGVLILLTSCQPATIEQQVEELMKTKDRHDRGRIASALADSLDTHALELIMGIGFKHYADEALDTMLFRYSQLIDDSNNEKVCMCVQYISVPVGPENTLSNDQRINFIVEGLQFSNRNKLFEDCLIGVAQMHGNDAMVKLMDSWSANKYSEGLLNAILSFGDSAIQHLITRLGKDEDAEELLAHFGESAVQPLIDKMKDDDQEIRFASADALVKMSEYNPNAVKSLTSAIDNRSLGAISRNYPFYIRMGITGTENLLLDALDHNFEVEMCVDYANCGNSVIENGASEIANKHGYLIYTTFGSHSGPKWGSGN